MLLFDYVNVLEYKGPFYADKSQNRECGGQQDGSPTVPPCYHAIDIAKIFLIHCVPLPMKCFSLVLAEDLCYTSPHGVQSWGDNGDKICLKLGTVYSLQNILVLNMHYLYNIIKCSNLLSYSAALKKQLMQRTKPMTLLKASASTIAIKIVVIGACRK